MSREFARKRERGKGKRDIAAQSSIITQNNAGSHAEVFAFFSFAFKNGVVNRGNVPRSAVFVPLVRFLSPGESGGKIRLHKIMKRKK